MKRLMLFILLLSVLILTNGRAEKNEQNKALDNVEVFSTETLSDLSSISVNVLPSEIKVSIIDDFKDAKICSAYKTYNNCYMVVLQVEQMHRAVYYESNGKFIKDEISIPVY